MRSILTKRPSLRAIVVAIVAATIFLGANPAFAHVGSPDVFYEGDAGPYHLFVTVIVPQVIPGVAEVEIRAESDEVRGISTAVTRLTGPGSNYAPVPDIAKRSRVDPQMFSSSLWLMEYGSLRLLLKVNGTRGVADMSVPVPSAARRMLPMPRWLGTILFVLAIGLAIGAISIVGAAARESSLDAGAALTPEVRRRSRRAMAVTAVIVATAFYFAFLWWDADASNYAAVTQLFKPPKLSVTLIGGNRLEIQPSSSDKAWLKYKVMEGLVPDHGHLMHLFLVRTPGLDRLWHLHPTKTNDVAFEDNLPSIDPGHYYVFADVVDKSGFPWTLVGTIDLTQISGVPLSGDDSAGSAMPIEHSSDAELDVLEDGTRVLWKRDAAPLRANSPMLLRFVVEDRNGGPAHDLEPYMGMAAHAEIIASDLSVFAHIHPSGSVPMASLMMASADMEKTSAAAMPAMSSMKNAPPESVSPEISMPYGFPKPGRYRIFFQFKRSGRIETAVFDTYID
jgi:hypothetical protein